MTERALAPSTAFQARVNLGVKRRSPDSAPSSRNSPLGQPTAAPLASQDLGRLQALVLGQGPLATNWRQRTQNLGEN